MSSLMQRYGIDQAQLINIFQSHLENEGLIFDGSEHSLRLEKTSKRRYLKTNHNSSKKKTAWYIVDLDKEALHYGWFHAGGANFSFYLYEYIKDHNLKPGDVVYTEEQREEDLKRFLDNCRRQERNLILSEAISLIYMSFEWYRSHPITRPHKYCQRKMITDVRLRLYNANNFNKSELLTYINEFYPEQSNNSILQSKILELQPDLEMQPLRLNKLLVKGNNIKNEITFLQTIAEFKNKKGEDKWSLRGVIANCSFHFIFKGEWSDWDGQRIILCEGLATGESIAEAIHYSIPVLVCFVAGNIGNVARDIRVEFPHTRIYFFADNDKRTASESPINLNPGIHAATNAAQEVSGYLIIPTFHLDDFSSSDWNDFRVLFGLEATTSTIRYLMLHAQFVPAILSAHNRGFSIQSLFYNLDPLFHVTHSADTCPDVWFNDVVVAYARTVQKGYTQLFDVEVVKDHFHQSLKEVSAANNRVYLSVKSEECAALAVYTKLVEACARRDALSIIKRNIDLYVKYNLPDRTLESIQSDVESIMCKFHERTWVTNYLANLFEYYSSIS